MNIYVELILSVAIASLVTSLVHPRLVKLARLKHYVDKPNYRRLNTSPIPVLGGLGIFFSIIMTLGILSIFIDCSDLFIPCIAMSVMSLIGFIDDGMVLSPRVKLLAQILTVCILMFGGGYRIDNFHGLWGVGMLPEYVSIPLTIVACVGLINAVNLIDGVDGLSSGFGILAAMICGVCFVIARDYVFAVFAFIAIGALLPFFRHNVYGSKFKMFIGDSGSLMLGAIFCSLVMRFLQLDAQYTDISAPVPFILAVFSVPVFDTVRVMFSRMIQKRSPFSPDKRHLHHMFIKLGFSHVNTALYIIALNLLIIAVSIISEWAGLNQDVHLLIVLTMSAALTWAPWFLFSRLERNSPAKFNSIRSDIVRRSGRSD